MLLQIHMNSFLPVASFPHKLEISCFWFNNKFTRSETGTNYHCCNCNCCYSDKRRTRLRWRWRWRCHSGIGEWELQEGRMAVSTYLQEMGVSEDESLSIASNAPAYLNMLVEGVRDLEQLSSSSMSMSIWDDNDCAAAATATASTGFHFRDKLLHIAANKGDNGKLAYLESLGFTLYSSMNVARYLSPDIDTLPSLIHKVSSLKQLLFHSQSPSPDFLIRNIRRMMRPLSISIDEDLQRTLSFFEKLEARRGGLSVLTSPDSAFCYLIESFPRILSLSVDNHLTRIVDFLHNIGIPRNLIPNIILAFPPILLWNLQLLKTRVLALKEIDVVDKDYAKLVLKYPWVLSTSIQENYKEVLTFLYSVKVAKTWIDHVIKSQPHLLGCSTSKLQLMVDQFAELGVQSKKLDQVIAKSPQLLLQKPRDFLQVVQFFEHMGLDKETIGRILARCPEIFATSIGKTLQRKIEFLKEVGVSETHLPAVIRKYPELLVSDIDKTVLQRIMYLMKLGLSEKEIALMVRTFSPLLGYSIEEVLRPKIDFLVNSMERPVRDVVGYPRYFSYSLEKKIKPRFRLLKGRNIKCSLKDMLGKNDEEFAAEFMGVERS